MSQIITIDNHGPLIVNTNFWETDAERAGKMFLSPNAGAIRLLLPRVHRSLINDMRAAKYVICSLGPWPAAGAENAVELLFEDGTDDPFSLHLTPESCAMLPGEPEEGQAWVVSVWDNKKGKPHKALERRCHWRRVAKLPCLKAWEGKP